MARTNLSVALFFAATVIYAQPQITSVTPATGPGAGGTTITIHGTGFDTTCTPDLLVCGETAVFIGSLPATSFRVIDTTTVEAVTPPSLPGLVDVAVRFARGSTTLPNAFMYTGQASDAFERILLPIFVPPVTGTSSAQFATSFSMWNSGPGDVEVFASDPSRSLFGPPPPMTPPLLLKPGDSTSPQDLPFDGDPGRFLYVPTGSFQRIAASLRVFDASRLEESAGTRVPVVPESEFRTDVIGLVDVPGDPNGSFRYTLRIYSLDPGTAVHVLYRRNDSAVILKTEDVTLLDPISAFHPGYAEVSDFHPKVPVRIEIQPATPGKRIWAFASVTNNSTQQITVVAPH